MFMLEVPAVKAQTTSHKNSQPAATRSSGPGRCGHCWRSSRCLHAWQARSCCLLRFLRTCCRAGWAQPLLQQEPAACCQATCRYSASASAGRSRWRCMACLCLRARRAAAGSCWACSASHPQVRLACMHALVRSAACSWWVRPQKWMRPHSPDRQQLSVTLCPPCSPVM